MTGLVSKLVRDFCISEVGRRGVVGGGGGEGGVRNSSVGSVLGSLSCFMQRLEFDPPLSLRMMESFRISFSVNMGSDSVP